MLRTSPRIGSAMANGDEPADVDPAEFADAAKTEAVPIEALPVEIRDQANTGRHRMTPMQFANGVELAERDGFQRGEAVGYARGLAEGRALGQADAVVELRMVREDAVEVFRSLFMIFEIPFPSWQEAEEWARRRFTPL